MLEEIENGDDGVEEIKIILFMVTFVESVELYPECLENGKFLKHIHFRFPVYYNGTVIDVISWENGSAVE